MVWVITMVNTVFTIGYSGFQLNDFVKILKDNGILLVIDVRSLPYSQHYADFNKENISKILKSSKIYYRNYASEFGARQAGIGKVGHSLILVKVTGLTIFHPNERSTKATFTYNNTQYNDISVTDPDYYSVQNRWYTKNAILVMSLPESPYNGNYYYKFVAKIFPI